MSTNDPTGSLPSGADPLGGSVTDLAQAMAKQIERLANEMFSGGPGPAAAVLSNGASSTAGAPVAPIAPPRVGPHALNVGAGGASSAVTAPPIPGPLHRPPLAATPPPKESDFRVVPTLLSENLGLSSPVAFATESTSSAGVPYFLEQAVPAQPAPVSTAQPTTPAGLAPPSIPFGGEPALQLPTSSALPSTSSVPSFAHAPAAPALAAPIAATPSAHASDAHSHAQSASTGSAQPAFSSASLPTSSGISFVPELVPDVPATRGIFDPYAVKRDFPILQERVHGRQIVWLDNAATTQKPQSVIDRLSYFYEHENSNVHRAAHTLAARSTDAYEAARDKVRRFVNASSTKEIIFVRGTTEGINLIAQSWGRRHVGPGDEIVITWLEHHANIVPWQQLCAEKGARLRVAPVDDRGQIKLDEYEKLLGPRTKIVSLTQVSNALGTITPAREMVEIAHRYGARVLVDGAQAVSHMPVDIQSLGCDFFVFSGHKVFGPTGIGVVYGKPEVLESMPPWQGGGNMIADVTFEKTVYQPAPARFEAGTGNIADAVGLGAAIDYVTALGLENIGRYEHELLMYAEKELARVPGLRMVANPAEKAGVLSFVLDGQKTEEVGGLLDLEGIAVRSGHHCAQPILRRFGVEGSVRASLAPYNTCEDIDALVAALIRLQSGRPRR
ncbi:MAG: family 2A encapsulin nanocompartment cargo protein cysteine desulfurase [Polyangiaceae bacterium]